ncbi:MAG: phage tail protein [Fusobacterium sp.]|nr:phage tail protein [Fusobacterium sp.]
MSLLIIEKTLNSVGHLAKDFLDNYNLTEHIGNIGCFGDISFISNRYMGVFTPTNVSVDTSNKTETFENLGAEPQTEFRNRNLRKVSLQFKAVRELVNIQTTIRKFTEKVENGEHYPLIIGGIPLSKNSYFARNFKYTIKETDWLGRAEVAEFSVDFEEYIPVLLRTNKNLISVGNFGRISNNINKNSIREKESKYILEEAIAEKERVKVEKEYDTKIASF